MSDPALPGTTPAKTKSPILIAVMGFTGSGKSTFINLASGSNLPIGHSVESCTTAVDVSKPFKLDGLEIILYDTPGFNDTNLSEIEVLKIITSELETQYRNNFQLHGIIYMHRISDIRIGGLEKANFSIFRRICGDKSLKNVVIVTNMWSLARSKEDGNRRVRQLETMDGFLKPALQKGARLMHHIDETVESAHDIIRSILRNHPAALDIQTQLVDENRPIDKTSAGIEVDKKIADIVGKYEKQLKEHLEAAEQARKDRDEETRKELLEEVQKTRDAVEKLEEERRNQAREYERFRNQIAEMEAQRRRDVEERQARTFISGLRVAYGSRPSEAPPERVREVGGLSDDINCGFGGNYVWLVPEYTTNVEDAIIGFDLFIQSSADSFQDLASGAGGAFRYLIPIRNPGERRKITEMALMRRKDGDLRGPGPGFIGKTGDLNRGRGGDWLYVVVKEVEV